MLVLLKHLMIRIGILFLLIISSSFEINDSKICKCKYYLDYDEIGHFIRPPQSLPLTIKTNSANGPTEVQLNIFSCFGKANLNILDSSGYIKQSIKYKNSRKIIEAEFARIEYDNVKDTLIKHKYLAKYIRPKKVK